MYKLVKKKSVSQLKKLADKEFSKYVRLRDGPVCITCEDPKGLIHAGHFMGRRFSSTRFEEENVNSQCAKCNTFNHGEQYKYALALDLKYGDGTAARLSKTAQEHHKFTTSELEEIIHDAKEQVKFMTRAVNHPNP